MLRLSEREIFFLQEKIRQHFKKRTNRDLIENSTLSNYFDLSQDIQEELKLDQGVLEASVLRKIFYDSRHVFNFRYATINNLYQYLGLERPTFEDLPNQEHLQPENLPNQEHPQPALADTDLVGLYYTYNISSVNNDLFRGIAEIHFDESVLKIKYKAPGNRKEVAEYESKINYDHEQDHLQFEVLDEGLKVSFHGKVLAKRKIDSFTLTYATISRLQRVPIAGFEIFVKKNQVPKSELKALIISDEKDKNLDASEVAIWQSLRENPPLSLNQWKTTKNDKVLIH